jgi:acetyl esterase/lipase
MARTAAVFRPDFIGTSGWTTETGIVYSGSLAVDVWKPNQSGRPVICIVHGGAWVGGDKAESTTVANCVRFADLGFCVFSANYTLNPADPQTPITEVQALVTWLRANAGTYNGLTDHVALLGRSAGGHLSLMAAITGVTGGTRPDAVIGWSPICDGPTLEDQGLVGFGTYVNVAYSTPANQAIWHAKSPTRLISDPTAYSLTVASILAMCPVRIVGSSDEDVSVDGVPQSNFDAYYAAAVAAGLTNIAAPTIYTGTKHSDFGHQKEFMNGADDVTATAGWLRRWMPWPVPASTRSAASRTAATDRIAA